MQNDLRLHHSRTEWPFSAQLDRKWAFRARVETFASILHRKIRAYLLHSLPFWSSGVVLGLWGVPLDPQKWENRAFGCRVVSFFTKIAITPEPNALLESKVGIWLGSGAGDSENLS
jgi:hypothetical protein